MRTVLTAKTAVAPVAAPLMTKLVEMLTAVSKNPSQPNFNHFLFESISALTRFGVLAHADNVLAFEEALFPIFGTILQQDILGQSSISPPHTTLIDCRVPAIRVPGAGAAA